MSSNESPNAARPLDFWVGMHLSDNEAKRADFVRDFAMLSGGSEWPIDGLIMLMQAFYDAAEDDGADSMAVQDLARDFQDMLFKNTITFDTSVRAYIKYLKGGVRDYTERDRVEDWEFGKLFMGMASYFAQEPERRKGITTEVNRNYQDSQKEKQAEKEAELAKLRTPEEIQKLNRRVLVRYLADILVNPEIPTSLFVAIVDALPGGEVIDFNNRDSLQKSLDLMRQDERKAEVENAKS